MERPVVLTIAGSDSGGGAGIQQDLKIFTVLGVYGASVITALTAQNTLGVQAVEQVSPEFVRRQLDVIFQDLRPAVAKTGMLLNAGVVKGVADILSRQADTILVIDPVMVSKNGHRLLDDEGVTALREHLFPLASIITPNIPEAEVLTGMRIRNYDDARSAAIGLKGQLSGAYVLLKGGHLEDRKDSPDILAGPDGVTEIPGKRYLNRNTHGTGCTLSAALTAFISQGLGFEDAARRSKEFVSLAIRAATPLGAGIGPTDPLALLEKNMARYQVLESLEKAWKMLASRPARQLVPEVQINLGYALPWAGSVDEVAAFPGRIVGLDNGVARVSGPAFGASSHVARIILTSMAVDPDYRSAMNIRYDRSYVSRAEELGYVVAEFSRRDEPENFREVEGSTLVWGVNRVIGRLGKIPDFIFDLGDMGKEPMIRVLGPDPVAVVEKSLVVSGLAENNAGPH